LVRQYRVAFLRQTKLDELVLGFDFRSYVNRHC
jgi:hypothetical protein